MGTVAPGWELKLAESGEILVRGPHVFAEYLNHPEATREVKGADGFCTGDIGEMSGSPPEGVLRLVDRARDFIVTAGGKTLSPSYIENLLRASPYVAEAMVVGHGRKYVTALIEIDYDAVRLGAQPEHRLRWIYQPRAARRGVQADRGGDREGERRSLARVEQVKRFRILPKALDPEDEGEPVTPTRKLKRALMLERFKALVDSMYDEREEQLVAREIGEVFT